MVDFGKLRKQRRNQRRSIRRRSSCGFRSHQASMTSGVVKRMP